MNRVKSLLLATSLMSLPLLQASQGTPTNPGRDASQGSPRRFLGAWGIGHAFSNKKFVGGCLVGAGVLYGSQRYSSLFRNKISKPLARQGKRYLNNLSAGDRKTLAYTGVAAALAAGIYFRNEIGLEFTTAVRRVNPNFRKSPEEIAREDQEALQRQNDEVRRTRMAEIQEKHTENSQLLDDTRRGLTNLEENIAKQQAVVLYQEYTHYSAEERANAQLMLRGYQDEFRKAKGLEQKLTEVIADLGQESAQLEFAELIAPEQLLEKARTRLKELGNEKRQLKETEARLRARIANLIFTTLDIAASREAQNELDRINGAYAELEDEEENLKNCLDQF